MENPINGDLGPSSSDKFDNEFDSEYNDESNDESDN